MNNNKFRILKNFNSLLCFAHNEICNLFFYIKQASIKWAWQEARRHTIFELEPNHSTYAPRKLIRNLRCTLAHPMHENNNTKYLQKLLVHTYIYIYINQGEHLSNCNLSKRANKNQKLSSIVESKTSFPFFFF